MIAASAVAKKPRIFENSKSVVGDKFDAATIAPTIITDEIAFVTDIKGVCSDGVMVIAVQLQYGPLVWCSSY